MNVLIIGANGNTGKRVTRRLAEHPSHQPMAMIRSITQRDAFDAMGAPTVVADLEYPIDHAFAAGDGIDAVIFAAGSGGKTGKDKTVLIDHIGAIRAAVTAHVHGAQRFVMLSALNAEPQSESRIMHYHRAKAHADAFLADSGNVLDGEPLARTVVCPGRLTDDAGTGKVQVSDEIMGQGETSRDNLAAALVACLDHPNTIGKRFSLLEGDVAIDKALERL